MKIAHPDARIVATNGCFDILHAGHISMLKFAACCGGFLVVGLNGDESIRRLKGPTRPINNENDRKIVLSELRCVDFVHVFPEERATRFLSVVKPHVYVKAGDYSLETMDKSEREMLEKMGTEIVFTKLVPGLSTTKILKSI